MKNNNNQQMNNQSKPKEDLAHLNQSIEHHCINNNNNNNNEHNQLREPVYIMTLELDKSKSKKIEIYHDSNPLELAFDFCKENNLDFASLNCLTMEIENLLLQFGNKDTAQPSLSPLINYNKPIMEVDEEKSITERNITINHIDNDNQISIGIQCDLMMSQYQNEIVNNEINFCIKNTVASINLFSNETNNGEKSKLIVNKEHNGILSVEVKKNKANTIRMKSFAYSHNQNNKLKHYKKLFLNEFNDNASNIVNVNSNDNIKLEDNCHSCIVSNNKNSKMVKSASFIQQRQNGLINKSEGLNSNNNIDLSNVSSISHYHSKQLKNIFDKLFQEGEMKRKVTKGLNRYNTNLPFAIHNNKHSKRIANYKASDEDDIDKNMINSFKSNTNNKQFNTYNTINIYGSELNDNDNAKDSKANQNTQPVSSKASEHYTITTDKGDRYLKTIREVAFIKLFNELIIDKSNEGNNQPKKLSKNNLNTSTVPGEIINDIFGLIKPIRDSNRSYSLNQFVNQMTQLFDILPLESKRRLINKYNPHKTPSFNLVLHPSLCSFRSTKAPLTSIDTNSSRQLSLLSNKITGNAPGADNHLTKQVKNVSVLKNESKRNFYYLFSK